MNTPVVLLTGGSGMLGSAIVRANDKAGRPLALLSPPRSMLDIADRTAVLRYLERHAPTLVIHAAAKVGGIAANIADPAGFLADNLALNLAVIDAAVAGGVGQVLNIGSSCMYPRDHRQPLIEDDILQGPLEPTNEGYALAKIVAARHCAYIAQTRGLAYRTIIPCNLYGPGDTYAPGHSHLVASVIAKLHHAKVEGEEDVVIWGDGSARREFLFVDDLASWIVTIAAEGLHTLPDLVNVGAGVDHSVEEYYRIAADVVDYPGGFSFDTTKPVGMRQKLMDSTRARSGHGWAPTTSLTSGIARTYAAFLNQGPR